MPAEVYERMMGDRLRLDAYRRALAQVLRPGDTVVDLGAGLGILSFLALEAGAAHVYAIEKEEIVELAEWVARENGIDSGITFIRGHSLDVELPHRVDILLSETLGSFGVDENTLAFTIDARDRLLREGGAMIPSALTVWATPVEAPECRARIATWSDIHGFDFSGLIAGRLLMRDLSPDQLLAPPQVFETLDLTTVADATVRRDLEFVTSRAGVMDALGGWFEARLAPDVLLSNAPDVPATHWQQAVFPLLDPYPVSSGQSLRMELELGPMDAFTDAATLSYEILP